MTVQSREYSFSPVHLQSTVKREISKTRQTNSFYFEFPETCCIKCFNGIYVMCVIAHNERYVGCASLCPLIPIIHLCGDLAVWIWLDLFDKGTRTITSGSVKFLFLASKIAITFFFLSFFYVLQISVQPTHFHTLDIRIKTWMFHLNINATDNKKLKKKSI